MSERDIIEKFKNIQKEFLDFLENEEDPDVNFQNLNQLLKDIKIRDCQHEFRLFLHMLVSICNNYHRGPNFFSKINQILQILKDDIKKYENTRIFSLFKSNKRLLLFLIEEKIMTVDEYFVKQIIQEKYLKKKYPQYFWPEIKPFMNEKWFPKNKWVESMKKELPENFYELRKIGENESFLSKLIRDDAVKDFIAYMNMNKISPNAKIDLSIYETNLYIIKKCLPNDDNSDDDNNDNNDNNNDNGSGIALIEYASFYGSGQIFRFLKNEGVKLIESLWFDVIHGKNPELIHLIEEYNVEPTIAVKKEKSSYIKPFFESIKCHHNDIANYMIDKYLQINDENSHDTFIKSLKYYNFSFMQNKHISESSFCHLCHYDYYTLAKDLWTDRYFDINSKSIQNYIFQ